MKSVFVPALFPVLLILVILTGCDEPHKVQVIENPSRAQSELPFLYTDNTGTTFLSWVEPDSSGKVHSLYYSKLLDENTWSKPEHILSSNSWFVNWADYPSIIGHSGEAMASHQLKKTSGKTYSYNVNISQKSKNGWRDPITPHFDSTSTEHGFVSMVPLQNDSFMVIWLDGRRTDNRTDEEYFNLNKAMTLRSAIIDSSGTVKNQKLIDQSVCDCCQTSLAVTPKGPIAAYRNRTDEEIRDIYISRYRNDEWSKPSPVHKDGWKIGACPVNGPKIVAKDSTVIVAWYTGAGGNPVVKAAVSKDYGETFNDPFIIKSNGSQGRIDAVISDSKSAYITEISKEDENHYLTVHKLSMENGTITSTKVSEINGSRRSGFPQMELVDNKLIFAWTEIAEDESTTVKTAELRI